jgi:hypothetical protein
MNLTVFLSSSADPRVVWRVLLHRAKRGLSVSSTVGSLEGHAQGSGQLLGMHTLQIPTD